MQPVAMLKTAHDPGDPIITSHCPFCGSGQVVGRSDGTIECGFCGMNYIVRVQPAFPGMPQGPMGTGAPTDVGPELMDPGAVGPDGMPMGPEEEEGGFPPEEDGEEDGPPFAEDEDEDDTALGAPAAGEDDGPPPPKKKDSGGKKPPAKKKASLGAGPERGTEVAGVPRYRTAGGDMLAEGAYLRHLAVVHSGHDPAILAVLRAEASSMSRTSPEG